MYSCDKQYDKFNIRCAVSFWSYRAVYNIDWHNGEHKKLTSHHSMSHSKCLSSL